MGEIKGKTAVITGAASGLGRGLALRLGANGASVVVSDVQAAALAEVEAALQAAGGEALAVTADVTKFGDLEYLASVAQDRFGTVDLVFLNAGVSIRGNAWELSELDWRWVYDVNLFGVVNGVRAFVPRLVHQGRGHVILTASNSALGTLGGIAPYVSSKCAVVATGEALQHDLRQAGSEVRVSVVLPAGIRSRIYESFRRRGPEYGHAQVPDSVVEDAKAFLQAYGEDPEDVADLVLAQAVVQERFYVLTDPRDVDMAEARLEGVRSGELGAPARPGVRAPVPGA